jgi:hypothetical protein
MLAAAHGWRSRLFVPTVGAAQDLSVSGYSYADERGGQGWREDRGVKSGCLRLLLVLLTASLATALTVAGLFFLISFAALSFDSPPGVEAVLTVVAALIAVYFFIRVGMSVWRDLRGRSPAEKSAETRDSAEDREG